LLTADYHFWINRRNNSAKALIADLVTDKYYDIIADTDHILITNFISDSTFCLTFNRKKLKALLKVSQVNANIGGRHYLSKTRLL
jgi:hypothetical protein